MTWRTDATQSRPYLGALSRSTSATLSANGGSESRPYPRQRTQRETGDRMISWGLYFQVSGLSHREPGTGEQVQVRVRAWDLYLHLKT